MSSWTLDEQSRGAFALGATHVMLNGVKHLRPEIIRAVQDSPVAKSDPRNGT